MVNNITFQKFILWLFRVQRDFNFNKARKRNRFYDCAAAYEKYRMQKRMFIKHHKIVF